MAELATYAKTTKCYNKMSLNFLTSQSGHNCHIMSQNVTNITRCHKTSKLVKAIPLNQKQKSTVPKMK